MWSERQVPITRRAAARTSRMDNLLTVTERRLIQDLDSVFSTFESSLAGVLFYSLSVRLELLWRTLGH